MCKVGLRDSPRCGGVACGSTSRCRCAAVGVYRREVLGCPSFPRSQRLERLGVLGWQAQFEDEEVRPLCGSFRGNGAGGYAKALVGFLALAVVLVSFYPHVAYAALASEHYGDTVYGPIETTWEGEGYTEVCYVAANRYDAAAYACGYSPSEVGAWDLTVRAKLSNQSTGGAFYELADGFYDPNPYDTVATQGGPAPGFWGWAYSIYGEGNLWMNDGYTDTLLNRAKRDVQSILSGESAGGESGGGTSDDSYYYFTWTDENQNVTDYSGNNNLVPESLQADGFCLSKSNYEQIVSNYESQGKEFNIVGTYGPYSNNNYEFNMAIFISTREPTELEYSDNKQYPKVFWASKSPSERYTYYGDTRVFRKSSGISTIAYDGKKYVFFILSSNTANTGVPLSQGPWQYLYYSGDDSGGSDEPPDNNWPEPDTPSTPNPPDPNPPSGGGNTTSPTLPKPTNPTQPINVTVTTVTPVDDILNALNKIIQELENHCVHLQNKMVECSKYIGDVLIQVRDSIIDAFDTNADFNARLHDDLMGYLEELFGWMRDNLNFDLTVTNSGDSADVVDWLKRIYLQDGTGYSNSRPIDITQDYNGFGVWVDGIVSNVLPDLTDTNLAPVTSAFDNLDDKFPFSVPSDILRIFQSLDKPAQTPVLTFTMPAVGGIPSYSYVVDLSPYDSAMQTVRTIELVGFVVFLLVWARRSLMTEAVDSDD